MMKKQNEKYIDSNICHVMHFLELKGHHNFLIGSNKIRNILYANDYDLNSELKINDTVAVLNKVHKEFEHIFDTAHADPSYYIIDFKCGVHNGEPIRWTYHDIVEGSVTLDKEIITFEEALLIDDNTIKLDMCYVYNGIFTDINCLYNIHIVNNKKDYKKAKDNNTKTIVKQLNEEINDLLKNGEHYKAL